MIRDNNLFTDVQEQALLLVEFDQELDGREPEHVMSNQAEPVLQLPRLRRPLLWCLPNHRTGFAAAILRLDHQRPQH